MKIDPGGAAGRRQKGTPPKKTKGRPGEKVLLFLAAILLALALGASAAAARGAEDPQRGGPQEGEALPGPVDFDGAARLALRQSPYFTKSSLEIEVKRLDETDSRYDLIPPITFRTQYYVNQPSERSVNNRAYSLNFISNNYNPMEAYFTLQGRKLLTQIAVLAHLKAISEGLQRMGRMFLEMEALQQAAAHQDNLIELARRNLTYFQNRLRIGTVTSLEIKLATQEMAGAQAEKERIAYSQKRLRESLQTFMGLKPGQPLNLDLKEARRQLTGNFDPATASLEQARSRSYELKIAALKKQLQKYHILMAKARLLPSLFFAMQTPDPLSTTQTRDLFFSVGLEVPVWDGFKRLRNISRQKTIMRQVDVEIDEMEFDLGGKWREAQENLRAADVSRKSAQAQEELARLRERQSEIRYHSGGVPLDVYLEGRKGRVDAERNALLKTLDYDLAVLGLRRLSGDLGATYVDERSWQE
ncbi:MAG: hypothetical protein A2Z73_03465 [Deltaproteobacteria bacterium RBG_13_60_28]|nr:MAG: hypothetical protein A2Z73_03465 [Deltaproteobacteria bacterium RBG_13_60_28]